jgi:hypothetical protein
MKADTMSSRRSAPLRGRAITIAVAGAALLAALLAGGGLQAGARHASASATSAGAAAVRTRGDPPLSSAAAPFDLTTRVLPDELPPTY